MADQAATAGFPPRPFGNSSGRVGSQGMHLIRQTHLQHQQQGAVGSTGGGVVKGIPVFSHPKVLILIVSFFKIYLFQDF